MSTLTDTEREIITFSRLAWSFSGAKESAIRERFGMSAQEFHFAQKRLVERPEAEAFDPFTVRRLRRIVGSRSDR